MHWLPGRSSWWRQMTEYPWPFCFCWIYVIGSRHQWRHLTGFFFHHFFIDTRSPYYICSTRQCTSFYCSLFTSIALLMISYQHLNDRVFFGARTFETYTLDIDARHV
jgi:hypothetical protein